MAPLVSSSLLHDPSLTAVLSDGPAVIASHLTRSSVVNLAAPPPPTDVPCHYRHASPDFLDILEDLLRHDPQTAGRVRTAAEILPESGHHFHGFNLVRELGRGAFARVFLAQQPAVADGAVVVKIAADAACEVRALASPSPSRFDVSYSGSISDSWDRDFYRVVAPTNGTVLTAMAWGAATRGLLTGDQHLGPHLAVYDSQGNAVAAQVLFNDGFSFTVQVANATPGAAYFVEVTAGRNGTNVGNYFLGVDFGSTPSALPVLSSGKLAGGATSAADQLTVNRAGQFHLVLRADATATMTIFDSAGNAVFTLRSPGGDAVSGNITLAPGRYSVRFTAGARPVNYALRGTRLGDPEGPQPVDPTTDPIGPPPPASGDDWSYDTAGGPSDGGKVPPTDPSGDPHTA